MDNFLVHLLPPVTSLACPDKNYFCCFNWITKKTYGVEVNAYFGENMHIDTRTNKTILEYRPSFVERIRCSWRLGINVYQERDIVIWLKHILQSY